MAHRRAESSAAKEDGLTKTDVDIQVFEMAYERRLLMAARRAADLFDHVAMFSTASLLRELAEAADFEVNVETSASASSSVRR